MRPVLLLILCLGGLMAQEPSADLKRASILLQDAANEAARDLATGRQDIEDQRKALLTELAAMRAQVLKRRGQLAELQATLDRSNEASDGDPLKTLRQEAGRITRLLSGETPGIVDPRMSPGDIVASWPAIAQAIDNRLQALQQDLRTSQTSMAVLGRDGTEQAVPVWRWGAVQMVALDTDTNHRGLLFRLDDHSWQVGGPLISTKIPEKTAPVDPSNRLAHTTPTPTGPVALFVRAGVFAWPIAAVALLGLAIIADRVWLLWHWRSPKDQIDRLIASLNEPGDTTAAATLVRGSDPQTQVLSAVMTGESTNERQQRAGAALVEAETRIGRGLRLLAALAASAPLLGLLGTVTGMITSFKALHTSGGADAELLSSGIGEALLTTEFGLIVAVPLLIAHAIFSRDAQRRRAACEASAMQLLGYYDGKPKADDHG